MFLDQEIQTIKANIKKKNDEKNIRNFQLFSVNHKPKSSKDLCWRVFTKDMNTDRIYAENLFDLNFEMNGKFYKIANEKISFKDFEKKINLVLHDVWCRYQYEIFISANEENNKKIEKIDIFTQISMNWEPFINYLWNNKKLIKKELKQSFIEMNEVQQKYQLLTLYNS